MLGYNSQRKHETECALFVRNIFIQECNYNSCYSLCKCVSDSILCQTSQTHMSWCIWNGEVWRSCWKGARSCPRDIHRCTRAPRVRPPDDPCSMCWGPAPSSAPLSSPMAPPHTEELSSPRLGRTSVTVRGTFRGVVDNGDQTQIAHLFNKDKKNTMVINYILHFR